MIMFISRSLLFAISLPPTTIRNTPPSVDMRLPDGVILLPANASVLALKPRARICSGIAKLPLNKPTAVLMLFSFVRIIYCI